MLSYYQIRNTVLVTTSQEILLFRFLYLVFTPLLSSPLSATHPSFLCSSTVTETNGRTYWFFFIDWLILEHILCFCP
uniref:Uncharacterized protein n=1 Tax=Salix viminalis TaxID=40686 RepID=A0A6N2L292_SALVM